MLYHEIAIEPTAIEDLKDLGLLERDFGFEHGRLIPIFPAKPKHKGCWESALYHHLTKTVPVDKKIEMRARVERLINKAGYRSRNNTKKTEGETWTEIAVREHQAKAFDAILCAGSTSVEPLLPFQGLHSPDDSFPIFLKEALHFEDVFKDPLLFLKAVEPLIRSAKRLDFIDPHFDPAHPEEKNRRRWKSTVRHIAEWLSEAKREIIDFNIHTKARYNRDENRHIPDPEDFVIELAHEISGRFSPKTKISVSAWDRQKGGIPFHARYILTDKAGIASDYGTDLSKGYGVYRTDVTLMPPTKVKIRRSEFDPDNPTTFEHLATHTMCGTR